MPFGQDEAVAIFPAGFVRLEIHNSKIKGDDYLINAKKAVELGIAEIIQQEDLNKDVLLATVRKILENKFQERAEQIQKEVIKWDGLETAAKIIVDVA